MNFSLLLRPSLGSCYLGLVWVTLGCLQALASFPIVHQLSTAFIPLGPGCRILDAEVIITYIYSPCGTCVQPEILQCRHGRQPWRSMDVLRITLLSSVNGSRVLTDAASSVSGELFLLPPYDNITKQLGASGEGRFPHSVTRCM